jgi:glycosyltransferase involved in cell wall biosynthesis
MRVLHVIPKLGIGGAERLVLDMLHEQNKRAGVHAELIYWEPVFEHAEKDRAHTHRLPFEFASRLLRFGVGHTLPAQDFIQKFKPDVIHSHLFQAEWVARCVPQKGIKYLSSVHDNIRQLQPSLGFCSKRDLVAFWERHYTLSLYRKTNNHFLAISEDTQAYLKTVLPTAMHSRVALLKNASPLTRFSHPQRAEWIPGSPLRLINVGSFVPKKNQKLAVLVLQELLKLGLDAQLTLAGDGPLKAEVQAQVRTLGLNEKVFFLGNITDIELQYKQADLYLHTAWEEPFGLVLMEAMASGLSVVALDAGGNRELISDGRTGRLLPLNSTPAQVGTAIQDWMGSQKQQQEARQQAMAFAAGFGIESYVDQLLLHYNRIQPA